MLLSRLHCEIRYQTYSSIFDSKYSDRGGYEIRGEGSDADGTTKVTDGFIAYDGSGWWLEASFLTGLKVLSKGTFDFANNTFSGSWRNVTKAMAPINENTGNEKDALKFEAARNLPKAVPIEMTPVVVKP
ncbi:hypothetical protein HJC23_002096 [Cyclotella cryptica]|uniref:FHA domain-containing protein n=1 Tax=Cyclotella cryptica TaxID=29204 RepID=A0ABD3P741_9STRA